MSLAQFRLLDLAHRVPGQFRGDDVDARLLEPGKPFRRGIAQGGQVRDMSGSESESSFGSDTGDMFALSLSR